MVIEYGPVIDRLFVLLSEAHARGVDITLVYDVYSVSYLELLSVKRATHRKQLLRKLDELKAAGVKVVGRGTVGPNPFAGRKHTKTSIIDDIVYGFGGVNLTEESFEHHDFMLERRDAKLASYMYRLLLDTSASRLERWRVDDESEVILDMGLPGESLIYEEVCMLTQGAIRIDYVSKLPPSGSLVRLLQALDTTYYFNTFRHAKLADKLGNSIDRIRYKVPNSYRGYNYQHAKFILFYYGDGSQRIISGSHNFSWRGVRFGTEEVALVTSNVKVCKQAQDYVANLATGTC